MRLKRSASLERRTPARSRTIRPRRCAATSTVETAPRAQAGKRPRSSRSLISPRSPSPATRSRPFSSASRLRPPPRPRRHVPRQSSPRLPSRLTPLLRQHRVRQLLSLRSPPRRRQQRLPRQRHPRRAASFPSRVRPRTSLRPRLLPPRRLQASPPSAR